MKFTILGSTGFIGSHLSVFLKARNHDVFCPPKNYVFSKEEDLGHIVYCIGLTSDFRKKPFETVEAHVCVLIDILRVASYESFLYLSSTRVYNGSERGSESSKLKVNPNEFEDLYNISKLMGESICLSTLNKKVRIARLSNVIGEDFNSGNFLFSLIEDAIVKGEIYIKQSKKVERDYIRIKSVVELLEKIAINGKERVYNVASGINISNKDLLDEISEITGCEVILENEEEHLIFPKIDNNKIKKEFDFQSGSIISEIKRMIHVFDNKKKNNDTN